MSTTHFWRFGDHELSVARKALRGLHLFHDGRLVAKLRMPLYAAEFEVEEYGRPVTYSVRIVKGTFPYSHGFVMAEIVRDGVHVVGSR